MGQEICIQTASPSCVLALEGLFKTNPYRLNIFISSLLTITEIHIKTIKTQKYTKV